jgi:hypothetical protein
MNINVRRLAHQTPGSMDIRFAFSTLWGLRADIKTNNLIYITTPP